MSQEEWRPAGVLGDLLPGELNDACCWGCSGGGDVVCCDGCRAVYHLACIGLASLPSDDFFCPLCSCKQCKGPCQNPHPAISIQTETIPVTTKTLKPRQSPGSKLPEGPGYVCPQQLRLWLQRQPTAHLEGSSTSSKEGPEPTKAAAPAAAGEAEAEDGQAAEPRPKRQRRGDPAANNSNSNTANNSSGGGTTPAAAPPATPGESTLSRDTHVRCCCCQRACHIKCLPQEQQQHLAAWAAATPQDSTDRDQNKTPRGSKRIRSPRGKKVPSKQEQEEQQRVQQEQEQARLKRPVPAYVCSAGCRQTAVELAKRCAMGVTQIDSLPDGTPVCWQLIQPAAVAAALAAPASPGEDSSPPAGAGAGAAAAAADVASEPSDSVGEARSVLGESFAGAVPPPAPLPASALLGTSAAPAYTHTQAAVLAQVLQDTQELLAVQLGPVWEVRTHQHCLSWLLSGLRQPTPGGLLDLSGMHVAVLWVGCTLAAAALLRVHGGEGDGVLEVTLAATSPILQHRRLGRALIGAVERFAMESCKVKQAWMPALGGVVKPCVGVSVLPGWERGDGVRGRLQLAPGCSAKILGLACSIGSSVGGAAAGSSSQAAEDAAQKVPKGVASCWALKLSYGRAANVTDWLQLTNSPLLRYSYVPFVSKRLEPTTMLPAPQFRKQQRPPPLPPLPPQMQMQPRFVMPQMLPPPFMQQQQRPMMGPMQPMQPMGMGMQPMQPMMQPHPAMGPQGAMLMGMPPHGMPPQGMPPQGMPAHGMPPQGMLPQGMPPHGMPPQGMQMPPGFGEPAPAAAAVQQQQQQPGDVVLPGPAANGSQRQPQGEGEVGGAAAAAAAAAVPAGGAADGDSNQQQQQGGEVVKQAAGGGEAPAGAIPQQAQAEQQQQQQQQPGGQQAGVQGPSPASKRQQWKEQVMQQFLAQQASAVGSAAAPKQHVSAAAAASGGAPDVPAAAGAAGGDVETKEALPQADAGPEPMQE